MREIVDSVSFEVIGFEYTTDEAATAVYAVQMYAKHRVQAIPAGEVPDGQVAQAVEGLQALEEEYSQGSSQGDGMIVPTDEHEVLVDVVLPFVDRMHRYLPPDRYIEICDKLGVKPIELVSHGLEAARMIRQERLEILFF